MKQSLLSLFVTVAMLLGSQTTSLAQSASISGSTGGTSIAQNTAVYIASAAAITGTTLDGAIVSISNNFVSGQDILGIDGTSNGTDGSISYSYNATTGILTLSGSANVATYQTTIRKLTYTNTSATPNTSGRTIKISLNKALPFTNGHYYEFKASSGITWTNAKTAAEGLNYFGLQGYLATISSDEENTFCASKLSGQGWIGASDATTEGAWKWVTGPENGNSLVYDNWASAEPNDSGTGEDYAHFLTDGQWNDYPNSVGTSIAGYVVEYGGSAGDPVLDISDDVTVNISVPVSTAATNVQPYSFDANWNTVSGATNYYLDVATNSSFTTPVSGYSNKDVGNVTTYTIAGLNPATTYYYRIRSTSVGSGYNSNTISLTTQDEPTSISGSTGGTSVARNVAVYIASAAVITGSTLDGAIVSISNNFASGQDALGIDGSTSGTSGSISYSYNTTKGILTLTGNANVATYQTILRKVTYTNTSATPNTSSRSITISLNNALPYSENGHYYEFISSSGITWADAKNAAAGLSYFGLQGYLATISSAEENSFCASKLSGNGWIGATDEAVEGTWKWATGPETGTNLTYTNWDSANGQPDNWGTGEDYAHLYITSGLWNDLPNSDGIIAGYIVEYGGLAGDQIADISDDVTVNISVPVSTAATNIQSYSFDANWNTVSGATNYYLDVATNSSFTTLVSGYSNKDVGNVTTYKVEGLNPVTTYYYRIRATSLASGFNSNTISATTIKADQTITFNALPVKIYGDSDFSPAATASSGLTVSYTTSDSNVASIVGGLIHIVGTGTCTIYADQAGNNVYLAAEQVSQTLTVNKATLTVTADAQTKVYGDDNPTLTFQYSGWKNSDDESDLDTKPTASTTVDLLSNVGTHTSAITVSGGVDNNYAFTYVAADFSVTAATLTVTADAQTKVYGDDNPTLTFQYSGWKNSDDESDLDTKPTASTTVDLLSNVGTHTSAITVSGGVDNNYAFTYVAADFSVTAATLTVTADAQTKVYGDDNPTLTFQYSGWKNSDDESNLDTKPTASTTVDLLSNVGTHTSVITVSGGVDNNYAFTFVAADFSVTAATLTVTADAQTKVYGDDNPTLTFQCSGWKNSDDESDLDTKPTASTTVTVTTSPGTYNNAITISGGIDNNYDFIYVSASFTITKGMLIIWVDPKTKAYGDMNPALTYRYTGFMNGDDESVLDFKPYPETSVTQSTDAGTYTNSISMTGGLDDSYILREVPANFTVTKASQSITFNELAPKTYGDESFNLPETTNSGLTISYTCSDSNVAVVSGNTVSIIGVGSAVITASQSGNNNYLAAETVSQTLTVNKKTLFVENIVALSKVYDGNANAILTGGTLTGMINSDVITLGNSTTGTFSQTNAGIEIPVSTAMTISGEKAANYELSSPVLHADITAKTVTVTAQGISRVCDQPEQALTYSFEPALIGTDTFTGTLTRTAGDAPGVYPILQGTLSLGSNYIINFTEASYIITNTTNMAPVADQPANLTVYKNSKEAMVTLTGIDPVSNCLVQEIESITATAENETLIPEITVDYTKGQSTAKLKLKIADGLAGETTIRLTLKDNGGTDNNGTDTREIIFNIKVEIPTAINDLNQNFAVRVFPNPSDGQIKVEASGFNNPLVTILNAVGDEIMRKTNVTDPVQTIDLSGNAPGIYLVKISDGKNTITKKLILKN